MEITGLLAGLVSIGLGILAIWLSITFYRMSDTAAKQISDANRQLGMNMDRIEKLFDRFYSDTFSIVRETYTDMRQQLWKVSPEQGANEVDMEDSVSKAISKSLSGRKLKFEFTPTPPDPERLSEIKQFTLEVAQAKWAKNERVKVSRLALDVSRAGFGILEVYDAVKLLVTEGKMFIATPTLNPDTYIADNAEEAKRIYNEIKQQIVEGERSS